VAIRGVGEAFVNISGEDGIYLAVEVEIENGGGSGVLVGVCREGEDGP